MIAIDFEAWYSFSLLFVFWTVITLSDLIHADLGSSLWVKKRKVRAEMVNRGSHGSGGLFSGRFHARKLTPSVITFYTIIMFAFSIFFFLFYVRNVTLDQDPRRPLLSQQSNPHQVLCYLIYSLRCFSIQLN